MLQQHPIIDIDNTRKGIAVKQGSFTLPDALHFRIRAKVRHYRWPIRFVTGLGHARQNLCEN